MISDIKRQTEEKIAEFRRNAEDAVNQVNFSVMWPKKLVKNYILIRIMWTERHFITDIIYDCPHKNIHFLL